MKAYTDIEQSKKLAEILPTESADMSWYKETEMFPFELHTLPYSKHFVKGGDKLLPCWSFAALLDVIPEGIIENYYVPNLQKENGKYSIAYGNEELLCVADNPIDACYEMILKLHEQKLL